MVMTRLEDATGNSMRSFNKALKRHCRIPLPRCSQVHDIIIKVIAVIVLAVGFAASSADARGFSGNQGPSGCIFPVRGCSLFPDLS